MTPPDTSASLNALKSISAFCATEPRTLTVANDMLGVIYEQSTLLIGSPSDAIGEKIRELCDYAADHPRPKTLPQARERLAAIAALIPAAVTQQTGTAARIAPPVASLPKSRPTLAASSTKPASAALPDSQTYARYESLKGAERMAFFSANRETLVREHTRRANAPTQTVHADLVEQYMSLAGQARRDFYDKHQRELFEAYRARNKR